MKRNADVPEIVKRYIHRMNLFDPRGKILAAVSGGADSLCLLLVLQELGYPLHVAHFDHGLRAESGRDTETVRLAAQRLGLTFSTERGDIRRHAGRSRLTLEEAARDMRYDFLFRTALSASASVIATGHTMDDQAETVLMHLLRGTGLRGLGGIRPVAEIPGTREDPARGSVRIVRPLLCLKHSQTVDYCRRSGATPLEDPSNQDPAFTRNRIRRELIPFLEQYNASIVDGLCNLADIAHSQNDYVERIAQDLWNRFARELEPGLIRIPRNVLRDAPPAIQQALARRAVLETTGDWNDLAYRHVIRIIEFAQSPTATRRMDLALGVEVALENDGLVFRSSSRMASAPAWELANLPVPGNLSIRYPDWTLETSLVDSADLPEPDSPPDPWTVWIDRDSVRFPFLLRRRREGDRFFPLGMPCAVRLNDFLASHHLPFSERDRWPLVCDSDGIIWVPGFRIKEGINPTDRSSGCIKIHINRTL